MRVLQNRSIATSSCGSAREHEVILTIEEGSVGGFGSHVLEMLAREGVLDQGLKIRTLVLPDIFQDQDTPAKMYEQAGLDARGIVTAALAALGLEGARLTGARRA